MSPELRQYPQPPNLLRRLRADFAADEFPGQRQAFQAYAKHLRGGPGRQKGLKRLNSENVGVAIGAAGYEFNQVENSS